MSAANEAKGPNCLACGGEGFVVLPNRVGSILCSACDVKPLSEQNVFRDPCVRCGAAWVDHKPSDGHTYQGIEPPVHP